MGTDEPGLDEHEHEPGSEPEPGRNVVDAVLAFFRVDVLSAIVVVGVIAWVVATALYGFILGRLVHSPSIGEWYRWSMVVQQWSYAVWLGALAILVLKWLRERLPN